jgi:RimJ/RimL family protein N-acetyltransferase
LIDYEKVDWTLLRNPSPLFKVFTEPTLAEVDTIVHKLMTEYLYAPDELRSEGAIREMVRHYFGSGGNIIYEIGDFKGILGIMDIIPEHKADVTLKLWGREVFGAHFIRDSRTLLRAVMDSFGLVRLSTQSADERIVRLARMAGFEVEGVRPRDFKWDGEYYDLTIMGLVRNDWDDLDNKKEEADYVLQGSPDTVLSERPEGNAGATSRVG